MTQYLHEQSIQFLIQECGIIHGLAEMYYIKY